MNAVRGSGIIATLMAVALGTGCQSLASKRVSESRTTVTETDRDGEAGTFGIAEVRKASEGVIAQAFANEADVRVIPFQIQLPDVNVDVKSAFLPDKDERVFVTGSVEIAEGRCSLEVYARAAQELSTSKVIDAEGMCDQDLSEVSAYAAKAAAFINDRYVK
ncbi:MAG: hypothetical protein AAFR91_02535 [Pseudomonadota bacterium]